MSKKVLLIADDDEMNRRIIKRFLKNDFEIIEAENGKMTMELLETKTTDALLLDIIMPEMDGLEVLEHMSESGKLHHTAVLVATSTKEKTERAALSLGADDVVSKPYDPIVIKKRLENIMAAKEIGEQREMLAGDDLESVLESEKAKLQEKVEGSVKRIYKCADIIAANKENKKLITDLLEDIRREADSITESFKTNSSYGG